MADNAGEIVFDRLLIELLPLDRVIVAVRGGPVLNDATLSDAAAAGLTEIVKVVDNGSNAPGTVLSDCSEKFVELFESSSMIISKGQGNFESLQTTDRNIFFLLKVKCVVVAEELRTKVGSLVIYHPSSRRDAN